MKTTKFPSAFAASGAWMRRRAAAVALLLAAAPFAQPRAETLQVAVASNFIGPMQQIAAAFERDTGHTVRLSSGATGKLYAQIVNGAPFDLLFAADDETPQRLVAAGAALAETRATYAIGRLVLWSARPGFVDAQGQVLREGRFTRLAIANPKTAPYGAAALQTLRALGLLDALAGSFVQGENIAQTMQFVASGNAELGFIAASQLLQGDRPAGGSSWPVPATLHAPIRQDMVLLARARDKPAAHALLRHMRGERAREMVRAAGYELPELR